MKNETIEYDQLSSFHSMDWHEIAGGDTAGSIIQLGFTNGLIRNNLIKNADPKQRIVLQRTERINTDTKP